MKKKLNRQIIRRACKKKAKDTTDRPIKIIRSEILQREYSFDMLDYEDVKLIRDRICILYTLIETYKEILLKFKNVHHQIIFYHL